MRASLLGGTAIPAISICSLRRCSGEWPELQKPPQYIYWSRGAKDWWYNRSQSRATSRDWSWLVLLPIVRSYDRWHHQSSGGTTSCTTNRATDWPTIMHDWWCDHSRLVVRPCKTSLRPLTIWNRRSEVLNMTIDLAATDFALAITHDLCD